MVQSPFQIRVELLQQRGKTKGNCDLYPFQSGENQEHSRSFFWCNKLFEMDYYRQMFFVLFERELSFFFSRFTYSNVFFGI